MVALRIPAKLHMLYPKRESQIILSVVSPADLTHGAGMDPHTLSCREANGLVPYTFGSPTSSGDSSHEARSPQ